MIAESDVRGDMVVRLLERMFGGDGAALVNHLIEAGEMNADELDELRDRVARKRGKKRR